MSGREIVKQKNGLYAIWCNTSDQYLMINQDEQEVQKFLLKESEVSSR